MLKVVMVLCIVMANMSQSSFMYLEYPNMEECKAAFKRMQEKELPPGIKDIYGTCSEKLILRDEKELTTSVEAAFHRPSKN
jgi:hypothetical protein